MKVLVANRGEIAVRIIKTARRLGHKTVAIYAEPDVAALHTYSADEAYLLPGTEVKDTYLNIERIIKIAKKAKVDAVHPGYGFLSESAAFVRALAKAKIKFIGPSAQSMEALGDKIGAKKIAAKVQVPLLPSLQVKFRGGEIAKEELLDIQKFCKKIEYPVLIKAAAGGGGRGMRKVFKPSELAESLKRASTEATNFFKDGTVFIEKFLEEARHVEVQIFGDRSGNVVSFFDRDCSVQRRHQKIVEEAPAPRISSKTRSKIYAAAERLARAAKYTNAGTVEFLLDNKENFYLLEVNSRLQVEHPVTEAITGLDLVELQLRICEGQNLKQILKEYSVKSPQGVAIELRLLAEAPEDGFIASTGILSEINLPKFSWLRFDSGFNSGDTVSHFYDSLLGKLIIHGKDREEAISRTLTALQNSLITGVRTNIGFLEKVVAAKEFKAVTHHINWVEKLLPSDKEKIKMRAFVGAAYLVANSFKNGLISGSWGDRSGWRLFGKPSSTSSLKIDDSIYDFNLEKLNTAEFTIKLLNPASIGFQFTEISFENGVLSFLYSGEKQQIQISPTAAGVWVKGSGYIGKIEEIVPTLKRVTDSDAHHTALSSPLPGRVIAVKSQEGAKVLAGDTLLVLESMKMEHLVKAPREGSVQRIWVKAGDVVEANKLLVDLDFG